MLVRRLRARQSGCPGGGSCETWRGLLLRVVVVIVVVVAAAAVVVAVVAHAASNCGARAIGARKAKSARKREGGNEHTHSYSTSSPPRCQYGNSELLAKSGSRAASKLRSIAYVAFCVGSSGALKLEEKAPA